MIKHKIKYIMNMMTNIYLGPYNLKEETINLLHHLYGNKLFDYSYLSIEEVIASIKENNDFEEIKNNLKNLKLQIFNDAVNDDDFIKELITIKDNLVKYDVDIDTLDILDELKILLNNITIKYNYELLENKYPNIHILNVPYDLFENKIIAILKKNNYQEISFKKEDNHSYLACALNPRNQIEIIIQYINENNLNLNECALVLCDQNNWGLYKELLCEYQIPYNSIIKEKNYLVNKFIALTDYYLNPNINNYLNIINSNLLVNSTKDINDYLREHYDNEDLNQSFTKYQNDDKYFKNVEINAEKIRKIYKKTINELLQSNNLLEAFAYAFSKLAESLEKDDINTYLQNYYSQEITITNYPQIRKGLLNLKVNKRFKNAIEITTLKNPLYQKAYLFVLDVTNNNFPNFKGLEGLLKEDEIKNSNYPSLKVRKDNLNQRLSYLKESKYTFYLKADVDYSGKSSSFPYGLNYEMYHFNYSKNIKKYHNKHQVSKELIEENYLNNNEISGSVSSFERYFNCPFSYFLKTILKLNTPDDKKLKVNLVGTLMHKILEEAVKKHHKNYYQISEEEIREIIKEDIISLNFHYPKDKVLNDIYLSKMIKRFLIQLNFFEKMETDSLFEVKDSEYHFNNYHLLTHNDINLKLNGIIDRIDESHKHVRVIDYKSSEKTISLEKLSKGLSLQLISYLYILKKQGYYPTGAYYASLSNKKNKINNYSYSITNGIVQNETSNEEEFLTKLKLKGINIKDFDFKTFYKNQNSMTRVSSLNSIYLEKLEQGLLKIYEYLINNIKDANFKIEPEKEACTYCDYQAICHNYNNYYEKEIIYKFKEEKDAK